MIFIFIATPIYHEIYLNQWQQCGLIHDTHNVETNNQIVILVQYLQYLY
jgi:hypothetical protein